MLKDAGHLDPGQAGSCGSCSEGAVAVIEAQVRHQDSNRDLLLCPAIAGRLRNDQEGRPSCGRETAPVPFIVAFTNDLLPMREDAVQRILSSVGKNRDLCVALETKDGFVTPPVQKVDAEIASAGWTGWRAPIATAAFPGCLTSFPANSEPIWDVTLTSRTRRRRGHKRTRHRLRPRGHGHDRLVQMLPRC